jgi:hypothetical protein
MWTAVVSVLILLLGGCQEFKVETTVDPDGSGARVVTLDSEEPLDAERRALMTIDEASWQTSALQRDDGKSIHRAVHRVEVADLAGWPATGGVLIRAAVGSDVRLVSEVSVMEVHGADGPGHVYRETLRWIGLREEVADLVGRSYAAELRQTFPDLADSLVVEARGIVTAGLVMNWDQMGTADDDPEVEERIFGQIFGLVGDRLRRGGAGEATLARIPEHARSWNPYDGIEDVLPGLDLCMKSSFELSITLPGAVRAGNADSVEGNVAHFRVDLAETTAAPVVLEVESLS